MSPIQVGLGSSPWLGVNSGLYGGASPRHISHPGGPGVFPLECHSLAESITSVGNPTGALFFLPQNSLGKKKTSQICLILYKDLLQKCP